MTRYQSAELAAVAHELDALFASDNAVLKYDCLSDALYWSDELPVCVANDPERFQCMQQVFRYRMTLMLDAPDQELASVWNDAKRLFTNWPGFANNRCRPNPELVRHYRDYHQRAIDSFRSLPD